MKKYDKITKENLLDILKWSGFKFERVGNDSGDYHSEDSYAWVLGGTRVSTNNYTINTYRNFDKLNEDDESISFDLDNLWYNFMSINDEVSTTNFDLFVKFIVANCDLTYNESFPLINLSPASAINRFNLRSHGYNKTLMHINGSEIEIENSQKARDAILEFDKLCTYKKL